MEADKTAPFPPKADPPLADNPCLPTATPRARLRIKAQFILTKIVLLSIIDTGGRSGKINFIQPNY